MAKSGGATVALMAVAVCSLMLLAMADENHHNETSSSCPKKESTTHHTWPTMKFGWRIVVGTMMGFCGAAFGSVGGVGGAGIFIPMLILVIGFDAKSSPAISKCMIMGVASATLYYNINQRHPTLDMPVIDYDLALLFQPMLVLGISIGVSMNVVFADWMISVLLILLCIVTSIIAFRKGIIKWKNETTQKEVDQRLTSIGTTTMIVNTSETEPRNNSLPIVYNKQAKVSIIENVHWKKLGLIAVVWIAILALQIFKSYTCNCSTMYWVLNFLQIPVVVAGSGYEAVMLYKGKTVIASRGAKGTNFKIQQLVLYCIIGVIAGTIGGMVGLGGGVILGPLFLEMGVPSQVSSATAMFAVFFSSSMSVVEYYQLKRFPMKYTLYFVGVSTIAALVGQYIVKRVIAIFGRESVIIFILAFTFFVSAFFIGGEGIKNIVYKIDHHKYKGFESLCSRP